jgi:CHAD domain-containing protein
MASRPTPAWPTRLGAFLDPSGRGPEVVHDLHRDLRRSRFEGQIVVRVLGGPRSDRSLERPADLRELERTLGRWRDVEIARELWRSVRTRPTPGPEARWLAARERSLDREAQGYEEQAVRLSERLLRAASAPVATQRAPGALRKIEAPPRWRKELEARRRRYLKSLKRIDGELAPEPAHAFRQELRRLGVFYDLLSAAPWAAPPRRPAKVQRVLDRLGQVHDLDRALARLSHERAGTVREAFARRLKAERRVAAEKARRALAAKAVRRYAQGGVRRKK